MEKELCEIDVSDIEDLINKSLSGMELPVADRLEKKKKPKKKKGLIFALVMVPVTGVAAYFGFKNKEVLVRKFNTIFKKK